MTRKQKLMQKKFCPTHKIGYDKGVWINVIKTKRGWEDKKGNLTPHDRQLLVLPI
jgi:hypothetical protein